MTDKIKIGISLGDINGIGPEVILKTFSDKRILSLCTPVIYGSEQILKFYNKRLRIPRVYLHETKDIDQLNSELPNLFTCWEEEITIESGQATEQSGHYAILSLEQATKHLKSKQIDALVTAPINKGAMKEAGFPYPGHTEYLSDQLAESDETLMFMINEHLRIGLVTNHLPVQKITENLTEALVLAKIKIMHNSLKRDFGINRPVIGVLGLNPHAGDNGAIGEEEQTIILPAIQAAKAEGILAMGPYPADGFFGSNGFTKFDGVLAMYHDQGLAPFKALSFGDGINFTAGLSAVRTSPDHGTAYDIAGKSKADSNSFRRALFTAIDIIKSQKNYDEITANPLSESINKIPRKMEDPRGRRKDSKRFNKGNQERRTPSSNRSNHPKQENNPAPKAPKQENTPAPKAPKQENNPAPKAPKQENNPAPKAPKQENNPAPKAPKQENNPAPKAPKQENNPAPKAPKQENNPAPKAPKADSGQKDA